MALSDYELRILQEIETDLSRPNHPRLAWACGLIREHWVAIAVAALAVTVIALLAVLASGPAVAPFAALCSGAAGYVVCSSRCRAERRNH